MVPAQCPSVSSERSNRELLAVAGDARPPWSATPAPSCPRRTWSRISSADRATKSSSAAASGLGRSVAIVRGVRRRTAAAPAPSTAGAVTAADRRSCRSHRRPLRRHVCAGICASQHHAGRCDQPAAHQPAGVRPEAGSRTGEEGGRDPVVHRLLAHRAPGARRVDDLPAADVERDVVDRRRAAAGAPEDQVSGPQLAGRDRASTAGTARPSSAAATCPPAAQAPMVRPEQSQALGPAAPQR